MSIAEAPFDPIAADDPQIAIPKRKGPRVLSDSPAAKRAREQRAARKAGGPAKRPRRAPARGPKSLAPEISAFLAFVNVMIIVSPLGTRPIEAIAKPEIEPTRIGDELDAAEIAALASALDAQCRRSPRFRKVIEGMLGAASGGTLVTVVALIAARRAARHGLLPAELDALGGMVLAADIDALASMTPPAPSTPDPETGETPPDRGADADAEPVPLDFANL